MADDCEAADKAPLPFGDPEPATVGTPAHEVSEEAGKMAASSCRPQLRRRLTVITETSSTWAASVCDSP
jgi:hypothetical protein